MFGPEVKLIAGDHRYDVQGVEIKHSGVGKYIPIRIGMGAWIGASAIILKGVVVGKGSIVGAGSVVTKSVGDNEIWAGNPARLIKRRFNLD